MPDSNATDLGSAGQAIPKFLVILANFVVTMQDILLLQKETLTQAFANGEWIPLKEDVVNADTFEKFFEEYVENAREDIISTMSTLDAMVKRDLLERFLNGEIKPELIGDLLGHLLGGEPDPNQPEPWVPPTEKSHVHGHMPTAGYL